ncbi:chondroitin sulfate proteoglycan 4 [Pelodytes ibericus]
MDSRLQLTFVPTKSSGLLFLASGENQYLMVELINGTLRVRLERGAGESVINSTRKLTLYNKDIHKLDLVVTESKMTLVMDNITNSMDLPWPPRDLNWRHGIFLGGTGETDITKIPENLPTYHGCILEATFDNIDLLSHSHPLVQLHGQWEDCQPTPTPTLAVSFGFLGPRSYLIFPSWDISIQGIIHLTLVTSRAGRAPLLFQSGLPGSYFYVEIIGGHLQMTIHTGETIIQVQNTVYVSDGHPHRVQIFVDSSVVQLRVDKTFSKLPLGDFAYEFDFHGNLYLGGVDEITLAKMRDGSLGDSYVDDMEYRSFIGCFSDLIVNSVKRGLHNAMLTRDVTAGCQDYEYDDYIEYEDTSSSFLTTVIVPLNITTSLETTVIPKLSEICKQDPRFPAQTSLMRIQTLSVMRGGSSILEWQHIHPTIDLGTVGIRQSQVIFSLVGNAQHGHVELDIPGAETRRKFTLLDVTSNRVRYVHDGSQSYTDRQILEVSITSGINLPECLRKAQRYTLSIDVIPPVAVPILQFPKGKKLAMLSHGVMTLTTDLIQITDSDTQCDQLTIYISGNFTEGQIELQHKPGEAIHQFSCKDLIESKVLFIHKAGNPQLTIHANDSASGSFSANLTIIALESQATNIRDTALRVSTGASALITPSNLPIFTNTLGDEVVYQLTEQPKFGEVQRLSGESQWQKTEAFQQGDLEKSRVRYFSKDAAFHVEDASDNLIFQIQLRSQVVSNKTLQVRIKRSSVQMMRMIPLRLGSTREVSLTEKELQVDSKILDVQPASLTYTILQSPRKGNLQRTGERLTEGSHFTHSDLQSGHISYAATVRNTKEMEDQFQFQVMLGDHISPVYTYTIQIGVDPNAPQLTNQLLHVLEGGEVAITADHLFLKSGNNDNFLYEVIDGPQHGKLIRKGSQTEVEIAEFTNYDILKGQLFYQHDGSETTEDDIPFVASMQREGSGTDTSGEEEEDEEEEEVIRGVFRVSVQLVNDNPPVQVVQKIFHVVRDGQRLLTTNDIAFSDPDLGSTDAQLVLVRYGVPFGRIVFVDDPSLLVFRFTQEDLRMHRILYIHTGADQGSIQLRVSDGLYQLTTILEVQTSDPFIHIANVTVLNVPPGGQATLSSTSLNLETNLDIRKEDEIRYHIMSQPRWGKLLNGGKPSDSFSQLDLADGLVVYQHNGEGIKRDYFRIAVEANQVVAFGDIEVQVGTEIPAVTLKVVHNEKVYVFQGEAAEIKKEYLKVTADDTFPHKVLYTLTDPPAFGYLVAVSAEPSSDGSASLDSVHTFTQEDINQGKILYLHSASEILPDRMTLEVAVGAATPQEIVVLLEILPFYIPMDVSEMNVEEGGRAPITSSILQVTSDYFLALQLEFVILIAPSRGRIINTDSRELRSFSLNEMDQGRVLYEHDGSETLSDSFTIVANATDINHHSQPVTVNVTVQGVNDESPRITTNRGLLILEGDIADISAQVLHSVDADSSSEEIVYSILSPTNGHVILRTSRGRVTSFSQKQVDQGEVQFKHKGAVNGGFFFTISDGEHQSEQHFFRIQVIPFTVNMKSIQNLMACPRSFQPITSQHLTAETNERKGAPSVLFYHIDELPQTGNIMRLANGEAVTVTNFTQSEVDAELIYYQHVTADTPFWTAQDYFTFHVTSPLAVSQRYLLNVTVTFQGPCSQLQTRLWKNTGFSVMEGGSLVINRSILDASNMLASSSVSNEVVFLLTQLPTQGHLSIHGSPLNPQLPHFLQSQLEQGNLLYSHTGSGIMVDSFQFKAWLWPKLKEFHEPPQEVDSLVITENLNITVLSMPKFPPLMSPPISHIQVAPGSYVTLTPDHLSVQDIHTSHEKIFYTILELPSGISVLKQGHVPMSISNFTQDDIYKQKVIIQANVSAVSGSIHFNVQAGNKPPGMALLLIKVPSFFKAVLEIPQASGRSVLTSDHVPPMAEGMSQEVLYRIIRQPAYGQLLAGKVPVTEFSLRQVTEGEISYVFTSFSSSHDEFGYFSTSQEGEELTGIVAITVLAFVRTGDREQWPRGCTVKLGKEIVDASELAIHTKSVPAFRVLKQPRGGRLVKFPKENGKGKNTITDVFTQTELEKGLIGVELWEDRQSDPSIRSDRIHMELSANQVPPANVTVKFSTVPYNSSYPYSVTLLRVIENLETTTNPNHISTSTLESTSFKANTNLTPTTHSPPTHSTPTSSFHSTTHLEPTTSIQSAETHLKPITTNFITTPVNTITLTTGISSVATSTHLSNSSTLYDTLTPDFSQPEDLTVNTTQDVPSNSSWNMEMSASPTPVDDKTVLGFMSAHIYNIIIPVCLVLFLVAIGLLLLVYLIRRKKMGMHHVQKAATSSAKPENGANERQTFRPTEPDKGIPLSEVGAEHKGNGAGGQAVSGSQYWV